MATVLALQAFLQHRNAARLAERAHERARELAALLRDGHGADDPQRREAIYHLFGECRFGFRHALEIWPGNDGARRALDEIVQAMVEHELRLGELEAARALLGEMEEVPPELAARVDEARQRKEAEASALRRLQQDLDPARGRRTRSFLAIVVGIVWTLTPLAAQRYYAVRNGVDSPWEPIALDSTFLVLLCGFGIWARESMGGTMINRRLGLAAVLAISLKLVAHFVALKTGVPPTVTLHEQFLVWSAISTMGASLIDWRLLGAAAGYLAAYVVTPIVGFEHIFYVLSAANAVLLLNATVLWWRPKEDIAAAREIVRERQAARRDWLEERFGRHEHDAS